MIQLRLITFIIVLIIFFITPNANAISYNNLSFADKVVSYTPGEGVYYPFNDPTKALGAPNDIINGGVFDFQIDSVSLGHCGELVLQFTNSFLTTSGDSTKDLWIFEVGAAVENMNVFISSNNIDWISVGEVNSQPGGIDIDAYTDVIDGEFYNFVKIIDAAPHTSNWPWGGVDIDAVGIYSTSNTVPEPSSLFLLSIGVLGLLLKTGATQFKK